MFVTYNLLAGCFSFPWMHQDFDFRTSRIKGHRNVFEDAQVSRWCNARIIYSLRIRVLCYLLRVRMLCFSRLVYCL